jgi:hypothetical protein
MPRHGFKSHLLMTFLSGKLLTVFKTLAKGLIYYLKSEDPCPTYL